MTGSTAAVSELIWAALAKQSQRGPFARDNVSAALCNGACRFSLVVEYDVPGGEARKEFTRIVPAGDMVAVFAAETHAQSLLHTVWAAQMRVDEVPDIAAIGTTDQATTPAPPCAASALTILRTIRTTRSA